ncbi:MAG: hypothetical protein A3G75_06715 [Verrucomicrobia bacterium RIFCSPLOWO2_12_FULL_64_8]|nr:MAG: hypothetical protein A3G75_06715 [Verrucomicrobia bacterium RIFCSPLOWO2_12_FULL_64_8]
MRFNQPILLIGLLVPVLLSAQTSSTSGASSTRRPRDPSVSAKKALPDPDLFDGSKHPPEKQPEYGMLGEFELPGDEQQSDRVGGSDGLPLPPLPGIPLPFPQGADGASGGGLGLPGLLPSPAGGSPSLQIPSLDASGNSDGSANPAGIRAAELKGGQPQSGDAAGSNDKPREIAYGDASLQIEPMGNIGAKDVVGTNAEAGTQRYKKGSAAGQQSNPANLGAEKGRTMPSGL